MWYHYCSFTHVVIYLLVHLVGTGQQLDPQCLLLDLLLLFLQLQVHDERHQPL